MKRFHLSTSDFNALWLLACPFTLRCTFTIFTAFERVAEITEELAAATVAVSVRAKDGTVLWGSQLTTCYRLTNWVNARPVLNDSELFDELTLIDESRKTLRLILELFYVDSI